MDPQRAAVCRLGGCSRKPGDELTAYAREPSSEHGLRQEHRRHLDDVGDRSVPPDRAARALDQLGDFEQGVFVPTPCPLVNFG
jgi:hypothetical protein